jgi:hypothetical protein
MSLRLIAAGTALAAFYFLWWSMSFAQPLWAILSFALLAASPGLFLGKRWAAYLWFLFAVGTTLWWLAVLARTIESGWPHAGIADTVISLLPGLLLCFVCVSGIVLIWRESKRRRAP